VNLKDFTYQKHQKRLQKEKEAKLRAKEKKKKKEAAKTARKSKAESKKQAVAEAAKDAHTQENKLQGILDLVLCILQVLPNFFGGFKCRIYKMEITVGGKEAADIAKSYGVFAQSTAYVLEILSLHTHLVKPRAGTVVVRPDFLLEKTRYDMDLYLQIRVGQILHTGVSFLIAYMKKQIS